MNKGRGTGIFEISNASQISDIAKYLNTPIVTYTHTSNKEVYVTAIDTSTDTFTANNHGLVDGAMILPTLNLSVQDVYFPPTVYPTPINNIQGVYFVVNSTPNTFKLSLTSGGSAIDITDVGDISKWHFETVHDNITIINIPNLKRCLVRIKGKTLISSGSNYMIPNALSVSGAITTITPVSSNGTLSATGSIFLNADIEVDWTGMLRLRLVGESSNSSTTTSNSNAFATRSVMFPMLPKNQTVSTLLFLKANNTNQWAFANGTTVEVFLA